MMMKTSLATFLGLALSLAAASSIAAALLQTTRAANSSNITLRVPETRRMNLDPYRNYTITVDTTLTHDYSAFSLQVHTQLHQVTLTNDSLNCRESEDADCTARGSNVGLVQLRNGDVTLFPFRVVVECRPGKCSANSSVGVLVAVVELSGDDPVPGGCTLTSDLLIDPNLSVNYTSYSTTVRFHDGDTNSSSYPTCDKPVGGSYPLQWLEYTIYSKCLGSRKFSLGAMMDTIEDMLTVEECEKQHSSHSKLSYLDLKKLTFASVPGQGVVYNVIATDKRSGAKSTYTPAVTYACDLHSSQKQSCRGDIPPLNGLIGAGLILVGLGLCLVGHLFFHGEVIVLHWVGGSFLGYMILSISSSMETNVLVVSSLVVGVVYALVWFLFWFMTGWYWFHVITFGVYADFIITAAILYSPLEDVSVFTVLQISYVYYLTVICGMILFMVPIVAFPRVLSVWSSALVGSYIFVFGIGMFTYTELSEIVLLVVKKFSIPGFYSAHIDCPPMTTDYIMMCVWVVLVLVGVVTQTTVVQLRRAKHYRRLQTRTNNRRHTTHTKFSSFPSPSLFRQILRRGNKRCSEGKPLLAPSRLGSSRHSQSLPVRSSRLPSDEQWSPGNSGSYSYGSTDQ